MTDTVLNKLLGRGNLEVVFQPIVALRDGVVAGAEALVRWASPTRGLRCPAEFLPQIGARMGLSIVTQLVVLKALDALVQWHKTDPCLTVAVNVTAEDCASSEFFDFLDCALRQFGVAPDALRLEVPEGERLVGNMAVARGLQRLVGLGVPIAIDDFGARYASLQHLLDVPATILKLDRMLIERSVRCARAAAIVQKTIEMASMLAMPVVAEGIQTAEQRRLLLRQGCAYGQGYFFGRPRTKGDFQQHFLPARTYGAAAS